MLRNVAVVVLDGFTPFEMGVVCEVFGVDRTDDGLPAYDFAVVASQPGPVRSSVGFTIETAFGLDRLPGGGPPGVFGPAGGGRPRGDLGRLGRVAGGLVPGGAARHDAGHSGPRRARAQRVQRGVRARRRWPA